MATKKAGEKGTRKLTKLGKKSIAVTLPIEMVRSLGWREKQKVTVKKKAGALVVRDAKTKTKKKVKVLEKPKKAMKMKKVEKKKGKK